jgi:hypothetical protein
MVIMYPCPSDETNEEKCPLSFVEEPETGNGIHGNLPRWLEGKDLMFGVERKVFDLLPYGHVVDTGRMRLRLTHFKI